MRKSDDPVIAWNADIASMPVPNPPPTPSAGPSSANDELTRLGGRVFWWGWAGLTGLVASVDLLDVLTRLHDAKVHNLIEPVWRAITDEYSSGLMWALLFPALWRVAQAVRPWDGRPLRGLAFHAASAVGFSIVHVCGFVLIRWAVWTLLGHDYRFGGIGPFFYELPKDAVTYAMTVGLVWGVGRLFDGLPPTPGQGREGGATFEIRDGAKVVRVRIDDILAVRSAGNYVEFLLADGCTPLMRATLAGVEAQLRPHGVARTHRSWLVNTRRIEAIGPAGSGDYRLSLKGGIEAPLSRRFRPALKPVDG